MTTQFPSDIDNLSTSRGSDGDTLSSPDHVQHHTNEDDAIAALEAKVGIDDSAETTSFDYLLKNSNSVDPGHKHTGTSVTLRLSELSDTDISAPADGNGLIYDAASGQWKAVNASIADASDTLEGIAKLSTAPDTPSDPIAVGANNTTSGTPASETNAVVDNADTVGSGPVLRSSYIKFGGTGADGALSVSSGTTTLNLGGASLFVKNYTSISISGTGALNFSNPNTNGTIIILKSQGDVTLTSSATPMLDASGMGAAGGAAVASSSNKAGTVGNNGRAILVQTNGGAAPSISAPGAGGAAAVTNAPNSFSVDSLKYGSVFVGAGGASGAITNSGGDTATSGAGGFGGGCLIIECGGALNFTTSAGISVAGGSGGTGTDGNSTAEAGGGGGGAGGMCLILYNALTSASGTITVSGGTGGKNGTTSHAAHEGGGGGGALSAGSNGTSTTSANAVTGGSGAGGLSLVAFNSAFL